MKKSCRRGDAVRHVPVTGGRTLAYVYDSGLAEADRVGREAVAAYAGSNGLDPTAFPSLLTMENELVGVAARLLDGPSSTVGTVTSGGTESVLLAVQTARDARPTSRPRFAAGDGARGVPQGGPRLRAGGGHGRRRRGVRHDTERCGAIEQRTVLVVAPPLVRARLVYRSRDRSGGRGRGVRCHVEACIGGWVLPYEARRGRHVRPDVRREGGTASPSTCTRLHTNAPRSAATHIRARGAQFFASAK